MKLKVHFSAGDGKGWAIDEDLRQIRMSLADLVEDSPAPAASIIHAAYWGNLFALPEFLLREKFVIVHADNPPFYSIKQVEFAKAQQWVNLWVARSTEAESQFRGLGLPVVHIPYTIDRSLFFPILDRAGLRSKYGIPQQSYVIANFHRDSEGADLSTPKFQKAPELMLDILQKLCAKNLPVHALLAGPRRHWMRNQLSQLGIPFTFVGEDTGKKDDFGVNILSRPILNELYNCADLYLIPSRWEGGPQSAMEAVACQIPTLSTPVGVGRDILSEGSLFRSASEAVQRIQDDLHQGTLRAHVAQQYQRWLASHTTETLTGKLVELYQRLADEPMHEVHPMGQAAASLRCFGIRILNWCKPSRAARSVVVVHESGHFPILDQIIVNLRRFLDLAGIVELKSNADACFCGYAPGHGSCQERGLFQMYSTELSPELLCPESVVVCSSVADAIHFQSLQCPQPKVVLPLLHQPHTTNENLGDPCPLMIVETETLETSWKVWESLIRGSPVLYPEDSLYYEQVFLGGHPCSPGGKVESLADAVLKDLPTFQRMIRVPNDQETLVMLERLLKLPSLR